MFVFLFVGFLPHREISPEGKKIMPVHGTMCKLSAGILLFRRKAANLRLDTIQIIVKKLVR